MLFKFKSIPISTHRTIKHNNRYVKLTLHLPRLTMYMVGFTIANFNCPFI